MSDHALALALAAWVTTGSGMSDKLFKIGTARGWLALRSGKIELTASGKDALRRDNRTPEERTADHAADRELTARLRGAFRELREDFPSLFPAKGQ